MRIGTSSSARANLPLDSQLLIGKFSPKLRKQDSDLSTPSAEASANQPGVGRLGTLLQRIRDESLAVIQGGASNSASTSMASQRLIDRTLSEISKLLGSRLLLGGAENANIQGVNKQQVADIKVKTLRPNATAVFTGSRKQKAESANVRIEAIDGLLQSGGRIELTTGSVTQQLSVRAGTSLATLVAQINSTQRGSLRAKDVFGVLEISTLKKGRQATLSVALEVGQSTRITYGPAEVSGLNSEQVASFGIAGLAPGVEVTVVGSRDSLATAAELVYLGGPGSLVAGTANFRLTGDLGSANFSVVQGETLADVQQRINAETSSTGVVATVSGDSLELRSELVGNAGLVTIDNVAPATEITTTGVNENQFAGFQVDSIPEETEITLTGTISQTATQAQQVYHGDVGGVVVDSAIFTLTGSLGSAQISLTEGEDLDNVAQRINDLAASTGVVAETVGEDLELSSAVVGSSESVQVTLDSVQQFVSIDGVNPAEVANFQVISAQPDSVNVLNASITQSGTQAELVKSGVLGTMGSNSTIELTGSLGSQVFSFSGLQSLTSARDEINAETASTGVVASVSGGDLYLHSEGIGSTAIVEVDVLSGSFTTSGGDGNGNAGGEDTVLDINGDVVTATGDEVTYADALGSYSFELESHSLGSLDPITVTSANGTFEVTGGDPAGIAYGEDAMATLNGQPVATVKNDFTLNVAGASFSGTFDSVFTGAIDAITVSSSYHAFSFTGGDENGTATGQDGSATLNGETLFSSDDTYTVDTVGGPVEIVFDGEFLGAFDPISVTYAVEIVEGNLQRSTYTALGSEQRVQFDGSEVSVSGDRYVLRKAGVEIELTLTSGFSGSLDPITVSAGKELDVATPNALLPAALRATHGERLQSLYDLASGGQYGDLAQYAGQALNLAVDALNHLNPLERSQDPARRSLVGGVFDQLA